MDADNSAYGHRSVSRRTAPAVSVSFKSKRNVRKKESDIEMRPLKASSAGEPQVTPINSHSETSAKQFADSWLGSMIKFKAKQAEKHAYNLRANYLNKSSKKGFHVQVPKRMMFYTILVFLVLPLILFMYKENHIHDHDPVYHQAKVKDSAHSVGNHSSWRDGRPPNENDNSNSPEEELEYTSGAAGIKKKHPTKKGQHKRHPVHHKGAHHQNLQQLLGGTSNNNNATTPSQSHDPPPPPGAESIQTNKLEADGGAGGDPGESEEHESEEEASEKQQQPVSLIKKNATSSNNLLSGGGESTKTDALPRTETSKDNKILPAGASPTNAKPLGPIDSDSDETIGKPETKTTLLDQQQPANLNRLPEQSLTKNTTTLLNFNQTLTARPDHITHDEERRRRHLYYKRRRRLATNRTRLSW